MTDRKQYLRTAEIISPEGESSPATDQTRYYRTPAKRVDELGPTLDGLIAAEVVDSDPPEYRELLTPDVWDATYTEVSVA